MHLPIVTGTAAPGPLATLPLISTRVRVSCVLSTEGNHWADTRILFLGFCSVQTFCPDRTCQLTIFAGWGESRSHQNRRPLPREHPPPNGRPEPPALACYPHGWGLRCTWRSTCFTRHRHKQAKMLCCPVNTKSCPGHFDSCSTSRATRENSWVCVPCGRSATRASVD